MWVRIPSGCLEDYVRHVDHLSNSLLTPDIPLYCKKLPKAPTPAAKTTPSSSKDPVSKPKVVSGDLQQLIRGTKFGTVTKEK